MHTYCKLYLRGASFWAAARKWKSTIPSLPIPTLDNLERVHVLEMVVELEWQKPKAFIPRILGNRIYLGSGSLKRSEVMNLLPNEADSRTLCPPEAPENLRLSLEEGPALEFLFVLDYLCHPSWSEMILRYLGLPEKLVLRGVNTSLGRAATLESISMHPF